MMSTLFTQEIKNMLVKEAIEHYGSVAKLAEALGVSRQCIYLWVKDKDGIVPELHAYKIENISNGALRVRESDYVRK